jgi:hypothetical protein
MWERKIRVPGSNAHFLILLIILLLLIFLPHIFLSRIALCPFK